MAAQSDSTLQRPGRPPAAATPATAPAPERPVLAGATPFEGVRAYVWELPVRVAHWTIVLAIAVLTVTGFYLHRPYLVFPAPGPDPYVFAFVRFVHEVTAFVFTAAVLLRIYWAFAGNIYARWRAIVPHTRAQWRGAREMLAYYTFFRRRPPEAIGHNQLAGLTYVVVYLGLLAEVLTGFALYAWLLGTEPWTTLFGWVPRMLGGSIQYVRLLHFLLMFAFLGFTIHHVYSAVLIDSEEKNGLMSSIVSGYKYAPLAREMDARQERRGGAARGAIGPEDVAVREEELDA